MLQVGGNEGDDGPGNEADRLLNFFPGAQAIGADECFGAGPASCGRGTGLSLTRRWREPDSNPRSPG
jgi:hypothetical protein